MKVDLTYNQTCLISILLSNEIRTLRNTYKGLDDGLYNEIEEAEETLKLFKT